MLQIFLAHTFFALGLTLPLSASTTVETTKAFSPEEDIVRKKPDVQLVQRRRRPRSRRQRPSRRARRGRRARPSGTVTVPINIGIAPTANFITGPIQGDQLIHTGLRLYVAAVLDQKLLRAQRHRIPRQYRKRIARSTEIRYNPYSLFTPHSVIISPKIRETGIYGLAFRPLGIGLAITPPPVRLSFDAGLMIKYMFIHSDKLDSPTHFIRPGLEFRGDLEFPIVRDAFHMSIGWASQFYPPQKIGGWPWEFWPLNRTIWHVGQAYLMAHFRFPYTTTLR